MRWIVFAVAMALCVAMALGGTLYGWRHVTTSPQELNEPIELLVQHGETLSHVANALEHAGIIKHSWSFEWLARYRDEGDKIQAGEYRFEGRVSPATVLEKLIQGSVITYDFALKEGGVLRDYLAQLRTEPKLVNDLEGVTAANIVAKLKLPTTATHGEGLFFPDTYQYRRREAASSILVQAFELMEERLDEAWRNASENVEVDSKYELLIVASMVERESHVQADRTRISGVIHRRLKRNMRLQIDPTIIYALGDDFRGRLRFADLQIDSPYNTYKVKGLPPTPISAASEESIQAAAQPNDGRELYFVSRGDGSSEFSETLQAHQAAVARYIKSR